MGKKTDNAHLGWKCALREKYLPPTDPVRVLDMFGGRGTIWKRVKADTGRDIRVLRIEKKSDSGGVYLHGDNRQFLEAIDLDHFDVIDIDAYGAPYHQVKAVLESGYRGIVHVTFIRLTIGQMHHALLEEVGIPPTMYEKAPVIFGKAGFDIWCQWLAGYGIETIHYIRSTSSQSKTAGNVERYYMTFDTRLIGTGDKEKCKRKADTVT